MKLTIFAATGGIGQQLVKQAVAAGHDVTAVARNPGKINLPVRVVQADLASPDHRNLEQAVHGADAVPSGLGQRTKADTGVATTGTDAIIRAMKSAGVARLVVISAAPVGTVPSPARPHPPTHDPGDGFFMRHLFSPLTKVAFGRSYRDLAQMEDLIRRSGLDWTVVRPPRLSDKPASGKYRVGYEQNLRRGMTISRADVAQLMLKVLEQPSSFKRIMGVAD
jgi:putative NADH-flavin reductase